MKLSLILVGLVSLAVQIFCQESVPSTEVGEINEVPASTTIAEAQPVQEPSTTEDKKLSKRSYGLGSWGWPDYSYGWPWPSWGGWGHGGYGSHGGGYGSHGGGYGSHGGGWYGGWYGGHGWPWWYNSHGSGWHGKW